MSAILDSLRNSHAVGTGAHVREVARDMGAMLRTVMTDNTTPAAAGQPTREAVTRTATRRQPQPGECRDGQMFVPSDLSYEMVDGMLARLAPCKYALAKADGSTTFFEVRKYQGRNRIQMLVGAPGNYQRYPMKLVMQFKALVHLLDNPAAAIKRFADKAGHCARCHSPLTDPVSLATGLGPDCRKKI
jgi:uncharacterized protein DUF6011